MQYNLPQINTNWEFFAEQWYYSSYTNSKPNRYCLSIDIDNLNNYKVAYLPFFILKNNIDFSIVNYNQSYKQYSKYYIDIINDKGFFNEFK